MQLHSTEHAPAHAIPSAEMFPMLSPVAAETQAAPLSPVGSLPVCTDGARTRLCAPPAAPRIDPQTCLYPVVPLPPQTLPVWGGKRTLHPANQRAHPQGSGIVPQIREVVGLGGHTGLVSRKL